METRLQHHTIRQVSCPHCGADCSEALDLNPADTAPPTAHDMCLCSDCAAVLVFNHDETLRLATSADVEALPPDLLCKFASARVTILHRLHQRTTN